MAEETVKQEGEFTLKNKKVKPKQLGKSSDQPTKVNLKEPLVELPEDDIKKVVIKKEDDAVQAQETNDSNVVVEEPKDSSDSEGVVEEIRATEEVESPLTVVEEDEEPKQEVKETKQEVKEVVEQKSLPENIEKLVSFMEETGGSVEDYVRLNADYSNVDNNTLIREYYKQTKPHLDSEEIDFLMKENFS